MFLSTMKFILLPNVYSKLKILGNRIMEIFERKFDMFTACDPKVACSTLFPLKGNTLFLNSIPILTGGHVDF
jgi:hypothetical protein